MTKTTVVHVNSPEWAQAVKDGTAVYIGRAVPRRGFKKSDYGNPFVVSAKTTHEQAVGLHEEWVRALAGLYPDRVREQTLRLRGKVLGCWCKAYKKGEAHKSCHGDLLARLADMSEVEYSEWLKG